MATPTLQMKVWNTTVHGNFQFKVHRGKSLVGTLIVDNSGIIWKEGHKQKAKRILWYKLQDLSIQHGYKVKP